MAKFLTLLEQHLDRQPPTVVIQAITRWEAVLALVKLQECGLEMHLPVKVSAYHINHIKLCAHSTGKHIVMMLLSNFVSIQSSRMLQCSASTQQSQSLPEKTAERAMTQSRSIPLCMFSNSVNASPIDKMHMLGVVRRFLW